MDINEIDAHWLKRKLGEYFTDKMPEEILDLEKQVMQLLALENARECDIKLAQLFNYEHAELNRVLVKNRFLIYYGIRM